METVAVEAESLLWSHLEPAEHAVESCFGVMLRHHATALSCGVMLGHSCYGAMLWSTCCGVILSMWWVLIRRVPKQV